VQCVGETPQAVWLLLYQCSDLRRSGLQWVAEGMFYQQADTTAAVIALRGTQQHSKPCSSRHWVQLSCCPETPWSVQIDPEANTQS
jgi:hypothetical protein